MHTETRITIQGDIDRIFALASAVEDWPHWLPHYRWVTVLSGTPPERVVEMAAHRDGFPVHWTASQRLEPTQHRIHFTHIRGISRGMEVTWFLEADGPLVHVRIVHDLTWRWWPVGRRWGLGPAGWRRAVCAAANRGWSADFSPSVTAARLNGHSESMGVPASCW
jgi:ribosome-associated toxin RatA of RatAB toxin-antitoxin module